jgi:hypothetical protein
MTHVGTATVLSTETKPRNLVTNLHFNPFEICLSITYYLWLMNTIKTHHITMELL